MGIAKHLLQLPLYSLATSLLLLNNVIFNYSNALTLELIPQQAVSRSIIRSNYLISTFDQELVNIPRPIMDMQEFNYIVKIGFGTFKPKPPFIEYYLDLDTGSAFTWIQCQGCTKCFKQKPNPFPRNKSTSFRPVLSRDNEPYDYNMDYGDGKSTSGIVAKETIYLNSNINGSIKSTVQDFIFGCGLVNNLDYGDFKNNRIAGIMGLGWGPNSFVNQIRESNGRFSYCLPLLDVYKKMRPKIYLRFGDDAGIQQNPSSMITMKRFEGSEAYYVVLQGISINKNRLNIDKNVFDGPDRNYRGGCIVDSGLYYSRIIQPAYLKLKEGLEDYFSRNKNLERMNGDSSLHLCYQRRKPEGFKNLPEITFHFQGGSNDEVDMVLRPEAGFGVGKKCSLFTCREYFCLAMIDSQVRTSIGAHQQTNQRIIFDTLNRKLIVHPEDCSKRS